MDKLYKTYEWNNNLANKSGNYWNSVPHQKKKVLISAACWSVLGQDLELQIKEEISDRKCCDAPDEQVLLQSMNVNGWMRQVQ